MTAAVVVLAVIAALSLVAAVAMAVALSRARHASSQRAAGESPGGGEEAVAHDPAAAGEIPVSAEEPPVGGLPAPDDAQTEERLQPGRLELLWSLAGLEQRRTARALGASLPGVPEAFTLTAALESEVERIREEVGTPGTLETVLPELQAAEAVVVLRTTQALLGALVRHCEAYDLQVTERDGTLGVVMDCHGFDDRPEADEAATDLRAAVDPVGGELTLDLSPEGNAQARLALPVAGDR